jgi:hypothetical protein
LIDGPDDMKIARAGSGVSQNEWSHSLMAATWTPASLRVASLS